MRFSWVIVAGILAGCGGPAYQIDSPSGERLAVCYDGMLQSFCQVAQPEGTAVVPGTGQASGIMQILIGLGAVIMGGGMAAHGG